MAQYHRIKWLYEREGLSQRKIAAEPGISRNTVRKYLEGAEMPTTLQRKQAYRNRTYSEEVERVLPVIDEWLKQDESVWNSSMRQMSRFL